MGRRTPAHLSLSKKKGSDFFVKKTQTQAFSNLIGGLLFLVLGIWALLKANSFQQIKGAYVQPAAFPQIMSTGLIIFSAIVVIQSLFKLKTMNEDDPLAAPTGSLNIIKNKGVQGAVIVIALCIGFVALFDTLGYVVCSALIGMVIMVLIGKRNPKIVLPVAIIVPLVMWIIFYKVLAVNIPMGVLEFLKDLVDMI